MAHNHGGRVRFYSMEEFTVKKLFIIAVAFVLSSACDSAFAGPFGVFGRRTTTTYSSNSGGSTNSYSGNTSTAQGVAEMLAARRMTGHFGGNRGREGTGMGSTPEAALRNCCFHPHNPRYRNNSINIRDQGVARGPDGNYYACIRE